MGHSQPAYGRTEVDLRIGHSGRIRLSELEQQLKAGRERDKFGILLDGRHMERAARIAITKVRADHPLSIVFADMNGLKAINEKLGSHEAADEAIRAFLQAFEILTSASCEIFSRSGDEVIAIMEGVAEKTAADLVAGILRSLPTITIRGQSFRLSGCAGVASTNEPTADVMKVVDTANALEARAKEQAKRKITDSYKPSVFATSSGFEFVDLL